LKDDINAIRQKKNQALANPQNAGLEAKVKELETTYGDKSKRNDTNFYINNFDNIATLLAEINGFGTAGGG
jgi:hypothetical protein